VRSLKRRSAPRRLEDLLGELDDARGDLPALELGRLDLADHLLPEESDAASAVINLVVEGHAHPLAQAGLAPIPATAGTNAGARGARGGGTHGIARRGRSGADCSDGGAICTRAQSTSAVSNWSARKSTPSRRAERALGWSCGTALGIK
jgi:hypothetical protein